MVGLDHRRVSRFGFFGIVRFYLFDFTDSSNVVLWVLGSMALADILMVVFLEASAPTQVTVAPGEKQLAADSISEEAEVISGFKNNGHGRVMVRGEVWQAKTESGRVQMVEDGAKVRIVAREGLTIIIGETWA